VPIVKSGGPSELCTSCGLCCNGVIFARGSLRSGDDPSRLRELGLRIRAGANGAARFAQPCPALCDGLCRIYEERPGHCREFECVLLKRVAAGRISAAAGLRTIRNALQCANRVTDLLRELGDRDEGSPLALRFRRLNQRLASGAVGRREAELFGRLTVAVHELNMLLAKSFYPGQIG